MFHLSRLYQSFHLSRECGICLAVYFPGKQSEFDLFHEFVIIFNSTWSSKPPGGFQQVFTVFRSHVGAKVIFNLVDSPCFRMRCEETAKVQQMCTQYLAYFLLFASDATPESCFHQLSFGESPDFCPETKTGFIKISTTSCDSEDSNSSKTPFYCVYFSWTLYHFS